MRAQTGPSASPTRRRAAPLTMRATARERSRFEGGAGPSVGSPGAPKTQALLSGNQDGRRRGGEGRGQGSDRRPPPLWSQHTGRRTTTAEPRAPRCREGGATNVLFVARGEADACWDSWIRNFRLEIPSLQLKKWTIFWRCVHCRLPLIIADLVSPMKQKFTNGGHTLREMLIAHGKKAARLHPRTTPHAQWVVVNDVRYATPEREGRGGEMDRPDIVRCDTKDSCRLIHKSTHVHTWDL